MIRDTEDIALSLISPDAHITFPSVSIPLPIGNGHDDRPLRSNFQRAPSKFRSSILELCSSFASLKRQEGQSASEQDEKESYDDDDGGAYYFEEQAKSARAHDMSKEEDDDEKISLLL